MPEANNGGSSSQTEAAKQQNKNHLKNVSFASKKHEIYLKGYNIPKKRKRYAISHRNNPEEV
ncbi:hypothetical protein LJC08_05615 [Methanimicrococcus sp. OttesenSCG-928-J09]|nr:hypothetical protein [Methanimicrococcus sp. OttesenSCG-928-J09]